MDNFDVEIKKHDNISIIKLEGEVDVYSAPRLRFEQSSQLEAGVKQIILDLTKVAYLDSIALGTMLSGFKKANEAGSKLIIASSNTYARKVFSITGLNKIFEFYDSLDDAIKALEKPKVEKA